MVTRSDDRLDTICLVNKPVSDKHPFEAFPLFREIEQSVKADSAAWRPVVAVSVIRDCFYRVILLLQI